MGLKDIFNASKIRAENDELKMMLTPEMHDALKLHEYIQELNATCERLTAECESQKINLQSLEKSIKVKKDELVTFSDDILVQEFGLYTPRFNYATSDEYKSKLINIRNLQKDCIKNGRAVTGNMNFTYNNSRSQGNKMVKDMQKLLMRAFNSECDETINNVKYNNFDMSLKKITASCNAISNLGKMLSISITPHYFDLKKQELSLALEYQLKKYEEKEALKQARAELREQAKLQKEIDEQRKKIEKEQQHYQKALMSVLKQLESSNNDPDLLSKKEELEQQLGLINVSLKDLDYREANQRAGYVYVISNIGSFGENIYKIGMTRRLDPTERIDELSDASVPFNFDVHAMIFTDDAPSLENSLHKAFETKKLNMVNGRREFFNVTLDEIKDVIKNNFDKTVEFIDVPDAEQYRVSLKIKDQLA